MSSSVSEWREVKLGDVADVLSGYAFKSKDFVEKGIPVVKIKNIAPPIIDITDAQYVSEELYSEKKRFALKHNDILISMTGSNVNQIASAVGKIGRVKIKNDRLRLLLNQRVGKLIVIDKDNCDYDFLYYFLIQEEIRYNLAASAGGSANQANISPNQIKNIMIKIPSLKIQKKIASILSALDEKIELNNRMNKVLELMAQAIFKKWFVDFEFPNENGEPYKSSGGEMEWCVELGMEVPLAWTINYLKELVAINERSITKSYSFESIKYVDISSVVTGKLQRLESIRLENAPSRAKRLTKHGDVLWSTVRPNRKSYLYIHNPDPDMVVSTGFVVLTSKLIPSSFLYCIVTTDEFVQYLTNNAEGSAYPAVRPETFGRFEMLVPPTDILVRFDDIVSEIRSKIANNERESNALSEIRDTLLSKLMSGEIDVSEVEL